MTDADRVGLSLAHSGGVRRALVQVGKDMAEAGYADVAAGVCTEQLREAGRAVSSVLGMGDFRSSADFRSAAGSRAQMVSGDDASMSTRTFSPARSGIDDEISMVGGGAPAKPALLEPSQSVNATLAEIMATAPARSVGSTARTGMADPDTQASSSSARQDLPAPGFSRSQALSREIQKLPARAEREAGAGASAALSDTAAKTLPVFSAAALSSGGTEQRSSGRFADRQRAGQRLAFPQSPPLARAGGDSSAGPAIEGVSFRTHDLSGIVAAQAPRSVGMKHAMLDHQDGRALANGGWDGQMLGVAPHVPGPSSIGDRGPNVLSTSAARSTDGRGLEADAVGGSADDTQSGAQRIQGDVFLDGVQVGRWISRYLSKEAGRASSGPTGFDSRRNPLLPGGTVGR